MRTNQSNAIALLTLAGIAGLISLVSGAPADNWLGVQSSTFTKLAAPWQALPIRQHSPKGAFLAVLEHAGCSLPRRDSTDARIIEEVRNGTATYGKHGIINTPEDVGGWPAIKSLPAPVDTDGDGMPDEWESRHGFDTKDASDSAKDKDGDGYTNIEEYLNSTDPTQFVDYTKPENNINALK